MVLSDRLAAVMKVAGENGILVPAFNVPYIPMLSAISSALTKNNTFALIEVARPEFTKFEAISPTRIAEEYNRVADKSVTSLHLDHIPVIDEDDLRVDWKSYIAEGLACGFRSVMVDGSRLPFEENVEVAAEVVRMAHAEGALVEAELGAVLGHSAGPLPPYEELFTSKMGFTDPAEAKEYVERTGVDWLSVSVGSIHGAIAAGAKDKAKPQARLDIEHLKKLRSVTGVPLVLHGGSGVLQSYVEEAIREGMIKINIGTEIRQPYERVLAAAGTVEQAQAAVTDSVSRLVRDVYRLEDSAARLGRLVGNSA